MCALHLGTTWTPCLQLLLYLFVTSCAAQSEKIHCQNGNDGNNYAKTSSTVELLHNANYKVFTYVRGDEKFKQPRRCTLLMEASESDVVVLMEMHHTGRPEQRVAIGDAIPDLNVAVIRNKTTAASFQWNNSTIRSFFVKRNDIVSVSLKLDNETAQITDNALYLKISAITNGTCSDGVRQMYYKGACYWVRPAAVLANQSTAPSSNTSQLDVFPPMIYGLDLASVDELQEFLHNFFIRARTAEHEVLLWGLEIYNGQLVRRNISSGRCQWLPVKGNLVLPKWTNDSSENNGDQQLFLTVRRTPDGGNFSLAAVDRHRASQLPVLQVISWARQQQLPRDGGPKVCDDKQLAFVTDNNNDGINHGALHVFGILGGAVLLSFIVTVVIVCAIRRCKSQRDNSETGDNGYETNDTNNGENQPLRNVGHHENGNGSPQGQQHGPNASLDVDAVNDVV